MRSSCNDNFYVYVFYYTLMGFLLVLFFYKLLYIYFLWCFDFFIFCSNKNIDSYCSVQYFKIKLYLSIQSVELRTNQLYLLKLVTLFITNRTKKIACMHQFLSTLFHKQEKDWFKIIHPWPYSAELMCKRPNLILTPNILKNSKWSPYWIIPIYAHEAPSSITNHKLLQTRET